MNEIDKYVDNIKKDLENSGITIKYDNRDTHKPGWKFAEYELKGVPVRISVGPRDIEKGTIEIARRDTMEKELINNIGIGVKIKDLLEDIQENLYKRSLENRNRNTFSCDSYDDFKDTIKKGGFVYAHWDGTPETEEIIKKETQATIRCIPINSTIEEGKCIYSSKKSNRRVLFAKSY